MSVATDSNGDPDPALIEIALPVPVLSDKQDPSDGPVLPGAPWTFLTMEATVFEAASDLDKIRAANKFSKYVIEQMGIFFDSRKDVIRSFACFPIFAPSESIPIGVLNVHRNRENPSSAERIPLLNQLLVPLCAGVGALLQDHQTQSATLGLSPREKL